MPVALFDLDNTLLGGDSDHLWGEYLVEQGIVDGALYQRENDRFYRDYREGCLDIHEFLHFALKPLADNRLEDLLRWREAFIAEKIEPILLPAAISTIEQHRQRGDRLAIITATNSFVTGPIATRFGIDQLIATEPELIDGRFTGRVEGTPCFREGKVTRLQTWLTETGMDLVGSSFYSDSHNDLPLLEQVEHPVAVDPDDTLMQQARARGWPIISLRD